MSSLPDNQKYSIDYRSNGSIGLGGNHSRIESAGQLLQSQKDKEIVEPAQINKTEEEKRKPSQESQQEELNNNMETKGLNEDLSSINIKKGRMSH